MRLNFSVDSPARAAFRKLFLAGTGGPVPTTSLVPAERGFSSPGGFSGHSEAAEKIPDTKDCEGSDRSFGQCEMKFLVEECRAAEIMDWAREHLDPAPYALPELGDSYHVNSLYLDTPRFDVYRRDGGRGAAARCRRVRDRRRRGRRDPVPRPPALGNLGRK